MDDVCAACLNKGRSLSYIADTGFYHIYSQILSEISVYDLSQICVRICWECVAALRRLQGFKLQVQRCYSALLQHVQCGGQDTKLLHATPRLQTKQVISIDYPEIKDEFDCLDINFDNVLHQESNQLQPIVDDFLQPSDQQNVVETTELDNYVKEEDHNELETFVNDLDVKKKPERKRSNKVKKIKTPKEKKKKAKLKKIKTPKIKKKKRKSIEKEIKSDAESSHDFEEDYLPFEDKDGVQKEEIEGKLEDLEEKLEDNKECDIFQKNEVEMGFENHKEQKILNVESVSTRTIVVEPVKRARGAKPPALPAPPAGSRPQCNECGKVFSSRKTLRYHLNVLHAGNNRYPCPRCGKVYQWKSNLGRHMRSHKARDTGELYCAACDKRFASVATYRQHLAVSKQHVSESQFSFTCDECGKKFVNKTRLRDHIDWEHLQKIKFRCQLCNKPFKCHTSLYVHLKNVHRNKGLKDNLCHVCGKSYQNAAKLRYHIVAMHTTQTPYQCEQCTAAFGWYSSLYRHVREVHYKMKVHPSKAKKPKKRAAEPPHTQTHPHTHTIHTHPLQHPALHILTHGVP